METIEIRDGASVTKVIELGNSTSDLEDDVNEVETDGDESNS